MTHLDIVVVSPEAPDPFGNPAGRWYYVLAKGLSQRGHRVRWLAAYTHEAYAARARASLGHSNLSLTLYAYEKVRWLRSKWNTLRRPYSYFISDHLVRDLQAELTRGYDVLHLEHTWSGWLGLGVPRVLLSIQWLARIDMAGNGFGSFRRFVSTALMKWTERHIITRFNVLRAFTSRDARVIGKLNPGARVFTIPLAIDADLYSFTMTDPRPPTIGLVGSMRWQPTRSAAVRLLTSIWPKVKTRIRDAQLLIVGWGARHSLASFLGRPDITILEDVPEAEPYFRQLSVLAYPVVHGSGMKVKVLEAMAYGLPVVTTGEGIEGIDAVNGRHVAITDGDERFADAIVALVGNQEARREMCLAARRLVEERYSPGPILSKMERAYESISLGKIR
jgi:glycosyltransferase involved in cell wall biosynthesis